MSSNRYKIAKEPKIHEVLGGEVIDPKDFKVQLPELTEKDRKSAKNIFAKYESVIGELAMETIVTGMMSQDPYARKEGMEFLKIMKDNIFEKKPVSIQAGPAPEGEITEGAGAALKAYMIEKLAGKDEAE